MMEWQPIETAPKDGTRILVMPRRKPVWFQGGYVTPANIEIVVWDGADQSWATDTPEYMNFHATDWMPLPKPPQVGGVK